MSQNERNNKNHLADEQKREMRQIPKWWRLFFLQSGFRIATHFNYPLYTENRNINKYEKILFRIFQTISILSWIFHFFLHAFRHQHSVMADGTGIIIVQNRKFPFTIYKNKIKSNEKANVLPLFNIAEFSAPFKIYNNKIWIISGSDAERKKYEQKIDVKILLERHYSTFDRMSDNRNKTSRKKDLGEEKWRQKKDFKWQKIAENPSKMCLEIPWMLMLSSDLRFCLYFF